MIGQSKKLRKVLPFLLLTIALTALAVGAFAEGEYRPLKTGNYGNDVLAVKTRLYDLGYFTGSKLNNRYTDDTAERVCAFEAACGLNETGEMSPALQALLFSDDAVGKNGKNKSGNSPVLPADDGAEYRRIDETTDGDDVLALKKRLKTLGYFSAKAETGAYNSALAESIRAYQRDCGLEPTGVADPLFQAAVFGTQGKSSTAGQAVPTPNVTPVPTPGPQGPAEAVELPALNGEGFLADAGAEPFIHADRKDGHWYYITRNVYVEIIRYKDAKRNVTWFETEIRCTPDSLPTAFLALGSRAEGHNMITPTKMGKDYNMVFGVTDDFYGYRWYNRGKGLKQGVIIRNGEIKAEETQPASSKKWPYLEIIALFADGSMRTFESDEHTAQEYLDMGVIDTFAFGPILIRDGVINPSIYDKTVERNNDEDPRMAIGCIEPCHYMIITAQGRVKDSHGVNFAWMAERFQGMGCQNALNLDGGGTAALYFMGDVVNKAENSQNLRDISSMFGYAAGH